MFDEKNVSILVLAKEVAELLVKLWRSSVEVVDLLDSERSGGTIVVSGTTVRL